MRTLVVNGTVVTATTILQADILIEEGCIVAIATGMNRESGDEIIDATGCYVMPGGVDVHTHCNLRVGTETVSDGFYHGSVAAAHGGTTTLVEHPGFGPAGCELKHQLDCYGEQAKGEMLIDYGFHGVVQHVDDAVLASIKELTQNGVPSFKVYLTYSGRLADEEIVKVLKATHAAGGLTCFHAEDHEIISGLTQTLRESADLANPENYPKSRPDYAEAEAISRLISLAKAAGNAPLYIVHLSTAAGLDVIRKARQQGLVAYAETCPQYLMLTESCYQEADGRGLQYIMAPPLRTQRDCDALWEGLADGTIDVVATDHCSFSYAQKCRRGKSDIFDAPGGIPGIETRIPLLFSEGVLKKRIELKRFVQLVSTNPARIMGLAPQKGDIAVGADGDLLILDPDREQTVRAESLHQHVDYTPFAGMRLRGWPTTVMLRGKILVRDGKSQVSQGDGRFIKRKMKNN